MFTQSRILVDNNVAPEVVKLYRDLDHARGGAYGTWHSRRIRTNPYPWFEATFNRVSEAVGDLTIDEWWFNCGEPLDEYRWHTHSPYLWAGVLYIQTPENSGGIEFRQQEEYYTHTPQAGEFLLFSGNLAHRILKNHSEDFRISVGFNFR
jgi:hypothetical protein